MDSAERERALALKKLELRRAYKELRLDVDADVKRLYDAEIAAGIRGLAQYGAAGGLLIYASMPGEVDTFGIIEQAVMEGKRVALPRVSGRRMEFYEVSSLSGLRRSAFGVLEPDASVCAPADIGAFPLCVVPGLCFDACGYRIGYGGGYYDRFLSGYGGFSAGVCYSMFMERELPRGEHDRRVDCVITENGVI